MALFIFLLLFTFPCLIFSNIIPTFNSPNRNISISGFTKLPLPPSVASTGSLTFDIFGGGPYTGTIDGRIIKYNKFTRTFQDFAYISPNRTKAFCDGRVTLERAEICGLPTGLSTDPSTGKIYTCDAFIGLASVGLLGGPATIEVPSNNGTTYTILIGVDAASNHKVYFTEGSRTYGPREENIAFLSGDSTGRLLEYDTRTKRVTVLLTQLGRPVGVATNRDASFVLVSEFFAKRIRKYYLKGPKAGTSEIFLTFSGNPNKIKRINGEENFWVGVNNAFNITTAAPQGVKFNSNGKILAVVDLSKEYNTQINSVYPQGGQLFVEGRNLTFAGRYNIADDW